jgi:phosphinothricin acetyltransferase
MSTQRPLHVLIRDAKGTDAQAIRDIYAPYVLHGVSTFEEVPPTPEEMLERIGLVVQSGFPYLVAELDGQIVGYAHASIYRPRPSYRYTAEDSIYVAGDHHKKGIGSSLLSALIPRCEAIGCRQLIAVVGDSGNVGSIKLHARFGFREVGTLRSVGFKLGRWVDTVLMQRPLGDDARTHPGRR